MKQEGRLASLLDLLALMSAGRVTVNVTGRPLLSVDADEKTLEVEISGAKEVGLRLSNLTRLEEGSVRVLEGSRTVAGALSRLGWKLTLCSEGERMLTMGSGAPRLTGRIRVSPLKLKKLLDALR